MSWLWNEMFTVSFSLSNAEPRAAVSVSGFPDLPSSSFICSSKSKFSSSTSTGQVIFILSSLKSDQEQWGFQGTFNHSYHGMTFWSCLNSRTVHFCFKYCCQSKMLHSLLVAVQTLYCSDLLPELCHFLFVCVKGAPKKWNPKERSREQTGKYVGAIT